MCGCFTGVQDEKTSERRYNVGPLKTSHRIISCSCLSLFWFNCPRCDVRERNKMNQINLHSRRILMAIIWQPGKMGVQLVAVCHSMPCHNFPHTSKVPVVVISPNMATMQSGSHVRDFHNKSRLAGLSFCFGNCQDGIVRLRVPYFQFHSECFSAKLGGYGSKKTVEGLICRSCSKNFL